MNKILIFLVVVCLSLSIYGQWSNDPSENLKILNNVINPQMIADGEGGAIVVGQKLVVYRYLVAQRVNRYGEIIWDTSLSGIMLMVREGEEYQGNYHLLSDGTGGLFAAFGVLQDTDGDGYYDEGDIYIQHVDSTGTRLWGDRALEVIALPGWQILSGLVPDGEGGMLVFWRDYREEGVQGTYLQRVNSDGELLYEPDGRFLSEREFLFLVVEDGAGGAFLLWDWYGSVVMRVDAEGNEMWTDTVTVDLGDYIKGEPDGAEGVILSSRYRINAQHYQLKIQRINGEGDKIWGEEEMVLVDSVNTGNVLIGNIISANTDYGATFSWAQMTSGFYDILTQRVLPIGDFYFDQPLHIAPFSSNQGVVNVIKGNVDFTKIYVWVDDRNSGGDPLSSDLYAFKLSIAGEALWSEEVVITLREPHSPISVTDSSGGAIVCWDEVGYDRGIFIQQVSRYGNLGEVLMGIEEEFTRQVPHRFVLYPNYPNPFNSKTVLRYYLFEKSGIQLTIYNVLGMKVKTWHYAKQLRGSYEQVWDGTDSQGREVSSGIYFAVLSAGVNKQVIQKMVLIR